MAEDNKSPSLIACTLNAGDFKARLANIADMNAKSLLSSRRDDLSLELVYAKGARSNVEEMVRREKECCAFLTFNIQDRRGNVLLTVIAPDDAREAADMLFEQFSAKQSFSTNTCQCDPL